MIVVRSIEDIHDTLTATCLTIGNFDGVHMGHARLLRRVRERAAATGMLSLAVTFDPHPRRVLLDKNAPPLLTMTEQKLELLDQSGVQVAVLLPFTRALAALEPAEFVREKLVAGLHMREMIIGYDYAFGKGRKGNFELLSALGRSCGFVVERLEPVIIDGAVVSSTRIRDMIQAGEVWDARALLGRFYQVRGTVGRGRDRGGRLLGFPTANLAPTDELVPKPGVYAVWVEIDARIYAGVTNIGCNPTFGGGALSVEVHILDFSGDLYGRPIRVHFVQRLRSERKFSGVEELAARIREDIRIGRSILATPEARIS
ncbi:bifunctional riboflavin kinase/FAD synthetase [Desulfolutivibrio sulfoxidireducens]|uniref:bifunctional riboflavin kinase/FAD synthetase n=1 Tax=Desulfolutivibrio sulfoxidireducens TaxID=2773299 RepID=UPI00159DE7E9|nr:bifunctional riboflavin kinase/FAD synthetase [Desulfolutivibrio sulfoxidireducens]QLA16605.1 bifunctional riboflavin kinase/FAD synthetase [Desulfolutivibrio sulfoxidireducens]QLA19513.1 bifunctional riboflavin kinase/FAD synthetase [Desulfolutivibrio sulfoxidireducens]